MVRYRGDFAPIIYAQPAEKQGRARRGLPAFDTVPGILIESRSLDDST